METRDMMAPELCQRPSTFFSRFLSSHTRPQASTSVTRAIKNLGKLEVKAVP